MNKKIKTTTRGALVATALAMPSLAHSAAYIDDFNTDTSANYIYTSTYGTDTATFDVSGGTLNLPVTGGGGQTANVFYNTAILGIGETVSVDVNGSDNMYLSVSTGTRGANGGGHDGIRLQWNAGGSFRARTYTNASVTDVSFNAVFNLSDPAALTLFLTRESDNTFSAALESGSGLTQLNTTGGTEKQIFTAGDTGNGDLFIGVETFGSGVRNFDNLTITSVPEPSSAALLGLGGVALILRRRK